MRKNRLLALLLAMALSSSTLASFPLVSAEEATQTPPEGYATSTEIKLNTGEFYKKVTGFEVGDFMPAGAQTTETPDDGRQVETTHQNNGDQAFSLNLTDGSAGGHHSFFIAPITGTEADWSKAKYMQFYIDNSAPAGSNALELFFIEVGTAQLTSGAQGIKFYDVDTKKWSNAAVEGCTHGAGLKIEAGFKGYVRIPLINENFNKELPLTDASRFSTYALIPGVPAGGAKVYFDDLGVVTYNGDTAPDYEDDNEPAPTDDYAVTDTVQLNPGEVYKPITGFEPDELVPAGGQTTETEDDGRKLETANQNNGDRAFSLTFTDGSQNGQHSFFINPMTGTKSDWSKAKYFQFYLDNSAENLNPLELFYIEFGSKQLMLNYGATGIKLYDKVTGKWTDATVSENSFHYLANTETKCPSLQIPAGFRGYVRIPLTDVNFTTGKGTATITESLSEIVRIGMFGIIPGVTYGSKIYFDDLGLVSYTGDTAPEYVDGEAEGSKPGEGGEDQEENPYKDQTTIFTLTGIIKDEQGSIMVGATVKLNGNQTYVTDSKGQFIFNNVSTGYIEIDVTAADGTELGYVTFNAVTGAETKKTEFDVMIAHDTNGVVFDLGMNILGPVLLGVTNGILDVQATEPTSPNLGDTATTAFALITILAAVVVFAGRKKIIKTNG